MNQLAGSYPLDVRVWLLWGLAAMVPLLTGRHPVILLELLAVVLIVRTLCVPDRRVIGWGWLLRIAALAVPLGMVFNVFTVHAGNQEMFAIPTTLPIIGGPVTWNALAYGALSGVTIVVLVAIGTTVAAAIEWSALMRLLPPRAGNLAVAGSVAWSFLPQLSQSWREIRESQAARGHRWRGVRDIVPIVVPLLAGGLDRSISTAEALESRGFGALASGQRIRLLDSLVMVSGLTAGVTGFYLLAVGQGIPATIILAGGLACFVATARMPGGRSAARPTRYRRAIWTPGDSAVAASVLTVVVATVIALQFAPSALRYEPYPGIDWPETSPLLVAALALLIAPAISASAPAEGEVDR